MKLKRIMALVLCFAMVLSTMSFNVFAEDTTETTDETAYVAQVGDEMFESVISALTYALDNKASELKLLADSREVMTVDYDLILDADLTITAEAPVTAAFYNDGNSYDFAVGANDDYTLTIGENVTFDLEDRVIWLGYYNDNCTVIVNGTLTCLNLWLGTDAIVNSTGKLVSDTHEFVMRRDASLIVNGGMVEASYFQLYTGHIEATNGAEIISHGPVNVNGDHSYSKEGDFSLSLDNSSFESDGAFNITAADSWADGVQITLTNNSTISTEDLFNTTGKINVSVDATSSASDVNGVIDFTPVETVVATANGVNYATLAEAVEKANGETITLVDDIAEEIQIADGATVVIDLDSNTLSGCFKPFKGSLTLSDGTIDNDNGEYSAIEINEGSLVLTDVNITSARHAVRIDGEVDATIDGGTYQPDATSGTRHAVNVSGAANVTIEDGTFIGPRGTTMDSGSAVAVQSGATVTINGGNFSKGKNATLGVSGALTVYGGIFDQDISAYLADGYAALPDLNGNFIVGTKPTATVKNLGSMTIPANDYVVMGGGSASADMPLNFVMQFVADQDAEDMQTSPFANWYADFVITFEGIEGDSFDAEGCYLAGYYGSTEFWDGLWAKIPVEGILDTIEEGVRYPVMMGVGAPQTYDYICSGVQEFSCAMFIPETILEANPDLKVNLELNIVDSSDDDKALEALQEGKNFYQASKTSYNIDNFMGNVAQIGDTKYTSLEKALKAATDGCTITLLGDITISDVWDCRSNGAQITVPVTIDGNGKTLKLTGAVDDRNWNTVFRFEADATVKNLTIDASEATGIQRGISSKYSITVDNCTLIGNGTSAKRGVIFGEGAGADINNVTATITDSTFKGWSYGVSDNQSGKDAKSVSITGSDFENTSVLVSASETVTFTGNTVTENGYVNISSYTAADTVAVTATGNTLVGTYDIIQTNPENITTDDSFITPVAQIGSKYYESLSKAITKAANGDTITLVADIVASEVFTIAADDDIILDLAGHTITGTDTTEKNYGLFQNNGKFTVKDSDGKGAIKISATIDSGWNRYSAVISNNPGGTLVVDGGTIEHLGGTAMAYGIDSLTNGGIGAVDVTINGGTIKSTYRAIRQFLNSDSTLNKLTVNGGTIEGENRAIFFHDPSAKANLGQITVGEEADVNGGVYLFVTAGSTEWPVEVSISAKAVDKVIPANVPAGYEVALNNGSYGVIVNPASDAYVAEINGVKYSTLQEAFDNAEDDDKIILLGNVTITEDTRVYNSGNYYDGVYYLGDKDITLDLNRYTLTHDGSVNDYLLNFKNMGEKANEITITNGTIDAGTSAFCAICTSSASTQNMTINTENVTLIGNNPNGAVVKPRGYNTTANIKAGTKIIGKDSYAAIESTATVNIYEGAELYQNGTTSYLGAIIGVSGDGVANIYGGKGVSANSGIIAMTSGGTINVSGGDWTAMTTNTQQSILSAQNDKGAYPNGVDSIINVSGGKFNGYISAWSFGRENEVAEVNITGGTYTQDVSDYVVEGYASIKSKNTGLWNVIAARKVTLVPSVEANSEGDLVVKTGETFTIDVKTEGIDAGGVRWVLDYDETKFELDGIDTHGFNVVKQSADYLTVDIADTIANGSTVATYTFKALNDAVIDSPFTLTYTELMTAKEAWEEMDVTDITIAVNTDITIELREIEYTVFVDGIDINAPECNPNPYYDGQEHTLSVDVTDPADASITYTVNGVAKDNVAITEEGVWNIGYTITKEGYDTVNGTYTLTIKKPEFKVEVGMTEDLDYVGGYKLVLVYTNADKVAFDYNGIQMLDASDSKYLYNGTDKYKHVFALVVEAIQTTDIEDYKALVTVDYEDEADDIDYAIEYDVNFSKTVNFNDIVAAYAVLEKDEDTFANYMAGVIKADVDFSKTARTEDITPIIKKVYAE